MRYNMSSTFPSCIVLHRWFETVAIDCTELHVGRRNMHQKVRLPLHSHIVTNGCCINHLGMVHEGYGSVM